MESLKRTIKEIMKYPSAVIGSVMILGIVILAIYAMIAIPLEEAKYLWRGGEGVWYDTPRYAQPLWVNNLSSSKGPETIKVSNTFSESEIELGTSVQIDDQITSSGFQDITFTYSFEYVADEFPKELSIYFDTSYIEKNPFVSIKWITPDGREYRIGDRGISHQENIRIVQDDSLQRRLGGVPPEKGLFADPNSEELIPLKGTYQVVIRGITFEEGSTFDRAELIIYGTAYGLFGTDHMRRDLTVPMLWGAPVALAFGLTATVGINLLMVVIAAVGVWYGGVVDGIIQRITEVNMVLPFLSILIMVGTFYSKSLGTILGVTILLSIFGGGIKAFRAIFLQIKESTYIEAAQAYGASNGRIIFRYLIPRIIPLLIPAFVLGIPSFVFLEASLAVLGLGDPVIPTWGKVINQAYYDGALYNEQYYWILEPAIFLMLTGLGFALLGFSLDRMFNPRLRGL